MDKETVEKIRIIGIHMGAIGVSGTLIFLAITFMIGLITFIFSYEFTPVINCGIIVILFFIFGIVGIKIQSVCEYHQRRVI